MLAMPSFSVSREHMISLVNKSFVSGSLRFRTSERWKPYYLTAVTGTLAADIMPSLERLARKNTNWASKGLILMGLFLGSVPTPAVPNPVICYHFASAYPDHPEFRHCIGAFLLLLGILGERFLFQKYPRKNANSVFTNTPNKVFGGDILFHIFSLPRNDKYFSTVRIGFLYH